MAGLRDAARPGLLRASSLFVAAALIVPLGGCGAADPAATGVATAAATTPGEATAAPGGATGAPASAAADTDEPQAAFVDGPITPAEPLPALGSATFTVDGAHVAEGVVAAGGAPLELALTDSAGLTWTLTIPAGALAARTRVTMTALRDVRSADIPIPLAGGVRLEPDGLRLDLPATLAVSGAGVGRGTVLLGGAHDGTAMDVTMPAASGGVAAASLAHFSSYAAGAGDGSLQAPCGRV